MSCLLKQFQDKMLQWKTLAKKHSMSFGSKFIIPHYVSRVTCHVSHVTCHVSLVTCKLYIYIFFYIWIKKNDIYIWYFLSFKKIWQSGGANWWRVKYQQSLPRLVPSLSPSNAWWSDLLASQVGCPPFQFWSWLRCVSSMPFNRRSGQGAGLSALWCGVQIPATCDKWLVLKLTLCPAYCLIVLMYLNLG